MCTRCNYVLYDGTGYKRRSLTQPLTRKKNQTVDGCKVFQNRNKCLMKDLR